MAENVILGIHHVTAICGDAQRNVDFYTGTLGLRLVKLTVNFDDPTSYHLYYGDTVGSPGTIMTFFNYPGGIQGARGVGSFMCATYAIPVGSFDYWWNRLAPHSPERYHNAHGENLIAVEDPDNLRLQFIERARVNHNAWTGGGIGAEHAIIGFDSVTLGTRTPASKQFMGAVMGLPARLESPMQSGNLLSRYEAMEQFVDVLPTEHRSLGGRGTIHHVAFRVSNDAAQEEWLKMLHAGNVKSSEVKDRTYFHSIYFREPGGALLEIATDKPGFAVDEPVASLGSTLKLPDGYEPHRAQIVQALSPLKLPGAMV